MKLLKRVNTVIAAQLHEVVECFESPERILKQTIREMEVTLDNVTESTARAIAGEKQLERRLAEARAAAERWGARARQAVQEGNDPAAGSALSRRFEQERTATVLADQLARCQESNGRLRSQLEQLRARLAAAKGEMGVLIARQRSAEAQRQFAQVQAAPAWNLDAFASFDDLSRRVTEAEAEAEALAELRHDLPGTTDLDHDVEQELQTLKAESAGAGSGGA